MNKLLYVGAIAFFVMVSIGIGSAQFYGAKSYLRGEGIVVSEFSFQSMSFRCTNGKGRQTYAFRGTRSGQPVRGYLCYGNMVPAVVHYE